MFRFHGSVQFAQIEREAQPRRDAVDGLQRVALPGLELRWDPRAADAELDRDVVAVATGRARPGGAGGEAVRWIERYRRHGDRAAEACGGGFSVAIVDLAKRRALLFVDRFSIDSLCYRSDGHGLAFSNSARDVPGCSRELDAQSLYDYLHFHVVPAPQTIFRDVRRLLPAHRLAASTTSCEVAPYWQPVFEENDRRDIAGRMRRFVDLVDESVREEADEPATACFLSGGTDSSTVAGMLRRLRGEPVHAYSIGFAAEGYDEMAYARIAARHFGLAHHEHYLTPGELADTIPQVAKAFDQPFGNSSVLPAYHCALRARQDGFTRMLAGDGGDELFGGNTRYALQKLLGLYETLPLALRTRILEPAAIGWKAMRSVPGLRQLGGYVRHSRVPMPDRLNSMQLLRQLGDQTIFEPAFVATVDASRPLAQQRSTWNAVRASSLVNRMLAYDWKFTLADADLVKVRCAAELAGLSVGYPLLGQRLTDFSLSLPPDWKVKGMKLRWFFKRALRDFLPPPILRKRKHGFGLPFGVWLLRDARLRELVDEALRGVAERGIVRRSFVDDLMTTLLPGAPSYYGEMVWILMMLELWLDEHASGHRVGSGTPGNRDSLASVSA